MKNIFKNIFVVLIAGLVWGCDDALDINTDPNNPTSAPLGQLLPSAQAAMATTFGQNTGGVNNAAMTFAHQVVNFRVDQYALTGTSFSNDWARIYASSLQDFEVIINEGTASESWHYVGIAQIQKAFIFGILVDLFGDVPYSEALLGGENFAPIYDGGQSVYADLFLVLDDAIANLAKTSTLSPSGDDVIYNGDLDAWRSLAKALKLKMYNNARMTSLYDGTAVNALIADADLTALQDFQWNYGTGNAPENRSLAFQTNWAAASREVSISPFFYQRMQALADPRMNYYWYNQIGTGGAAQNPTDFADDTADGLFVSFRFGAIGPTSSFDQRQSQSVLGLYPAGGAYNTTGGAGVGAAGGTDAAGTAPERFFTNYALQFVMAELALEEGATGNAGDYFEAGIQAAFDKVNEVAGIVGGGAPSISQATIDGYKTAQRTAFDGASQSQQLDFIMQQKAIASFGWGIDSYSDIRRTGFPAIYDPNGDGSSDTQSTRSFPVSYTYADAELASNPNAPAQRTVATDKVFWDVN